jgi:hypothetical protein
MLSATAVPEGAKPAPATNWRCAVTIDNTAGDTITSDNGAAYVDGEGGVTCSVVGDSSSSHYGWLYLAFSPSGPRYLSFPGQLSGENGAPGYSAFTSLGKGRSKTTFEVKELARATLAAPVDVLPFRSYAFSPQFTQGSARFRGDSNFTGGDDLAGTSSVFVSVHGDGCGWDVWANPDAALMTTLLGEKPATRLSPRVMELGEGSWHSVRGYYRMQFFAAVRVIAGKNGC